MPKSNWYARVFFVTALFVVWIAATSSASANPVQLTNNAFDDTAPQISGNNIVWAGFDGNDAEIFLYNGTSVIQLTDNTIDDYSPKIDSGQVVWLAGPSSRLVAQVWFYDGFFKTCLDNTISSKDYPQISGNKVVWSRFENNTWEIFLYDGVAAEPLTNNAVEDRTPKISGNNIVWNRWDGQNFELVYYDGSTTTQFTNQNVDDLGLREPRIDGNNVIWATSPTRDPATWIFQNELFLYNGLTVTQLTNNYFYDGNPEISGNNVVWVAFPDMKLGVETKGPEIFSYDGKIIRQLTNNTLEENWPKISGPNVVWEANDGHDWEIFTSDVAAAADTEKPSASVIAPVFSTELSKAATFKIAWSGTDPAPSSGIASYDVQYRVGSGGTWTNWKTAITATSTNFKGKAGKTYYFRARAKDNAGNVGGWSIAKKTIVPYDNNSLISGRTGFAGTYSSTKSKFYKSTVRYSTAAGESITYKFTGKSVALIGPKARNRSKAKIYINSRYVKTIDAYASTLRHRKVLYAKIFKRGGTRTITIENVGNRSRFDVDALGVGR